MSERGAEKDVWKTHMRIGSFSCLISKSTDQVSADHLLSPSSVPRTLSGRHPATGHGWHLIKLGLRMFCLVGLFAWLAVGCRQQVTATPSTTATLEPTATFLPTFTSSASRVLPTLYPTRTLIAPTTDLFDNYESYPAGCTIVSSFDQIPTGQEIPDLNSMVDVKFDFDQPRYFSGDPIRLSATLRRVGVLDWEIVHKAIVKVLVDDPASRRSSFSMYDDGAHGDGEANDGTFAFTVNDTLTPGIYKFILQVTAPPISGKEPVLEDCPIAKSVFPKITQDTLSNTCKSVTASDPIVVRSESEGGNDTVDLGQTAFDPRAIDTGSGMLATWIVSFDGQYPVPNAYIRQLDEDGHPTGPIQLVFDRNIIGAPTLFRLGDRLVLDYCGRFNTNQDRIASTFLDSSGHSLSTQVRMPNNRVCGPAGTAVWTGKHIIFGSADLASSNSDYTAMLDVADENGNSLLWKVIQTNVTTVPQLAVGHGQLLAILSTNPGTTEIHRFDLDANEIASPVVIKPFLFESDGHIYQGYLRSASAVPTQDGWLIISTLWGGKGIYVTRMTEDGTILSGPSAVYIDTDFINGLDQIIPYRGGAVVLGETMQGYVILFVAPDGTIENRWLPEEGQDPYGGSLFVSKERLFLIYPSSISKASEANQVRIRELKCTQ